MNVRVKLTVADLAANTRNALVGGPFGSNLVSRDYTSTGVPVIRGQNMGSRWISGEFAYVSPEKAKELSANIARPRDLVFTQRGTLGQVALVPNEPFEEYVVSQSQMKLTVDKAKANPLFLYYVFNSPEQMEYIRQNAIQVGVPHTNLGILRATPLELPPITDQESIATILGGLDDKIELNRRLGETLEAIAQALFQSWFVDFDPAPFKVAMRDSTLGREVQRCGGFIQTGPFGSQLHASDYQTDGVPVVMPQDLQSRRVSVERVARVSRTKAGSLDRHRLQVGDVVYSRRGDVERHALISDRETGWLCGTGCLLIRPGKAWPSQAYLSEWLNLLETRTWLKQHAVGATMPNLNTGILAALPIRVPDDSALIAFEDRVNALRTHQSNLSEESESLTELRDALLPRLLSGELAALASIAEEACA